MHLPRRIRAKVNQQQRGQGKKSKPETTTNTANTTTNASGPDGLVLDMSTIPGMPPQPATYVPLSTAQAAVPPANQLKTTTTANKKALVGRRKKNMKDEILGKAAPTMQSRPKLRSTGMINQPKQGY